jgi:hypothetical protein
MLSPPARQVHRADRRYRRPHHCRLRRMVVREEPQAEYSLFFVWV